jgi:hypothetical protein
MARFEDYLPGGDNDPNAPAGGIDKEIKDAEQDQQARKDDATPVDWEERFKQLEKLNSQQAQTVGAYRKVIDNFIASPTPASEPAPEPSKPITWDDLQENPDEALNRAVASHPAIAEAKEIKEQFEANQRQQDVNTFLERHPDFEEIKTSTEFGNWVQENSTRQALAASADNWDMNSADALFSLYKAEKGLSQKQEEQEASEAIQAASLEDSSAVMVAPDARFSRQEFVEKKIAAEQGDQSAQRWINANVAAYRTALQSGNVRD